MTRWEYKILRNQDLSVFNELGSYGWELVAALPQVPYVYGPRDTFVFKRACGVASEDKHTELGTLTEWRDQARATTTS